MTTMYSSSDPPPGGGERLGLGEEGGNGGQRAPPPPPPAATARIDITRALEDTANVLTAPDKVGERDEMEKEM